VEIYKKRISSKSTPSNPDSTVENWGKRFLWGATDYEYKGLQNSANSSNYSAYVKND